jgi:hypothetical protein
MPIRPAVFARKTGVFRTMSALQTSSNGDQRLRTCVLARRSALAGKATSIQHPLAEAVALLNSDTPETLQPELFTAACLVGVGVGHCGTASGYHRFVGGEIPPYLGQRHVGRNALAVDSLAQSLEPTPMRSASRHMTQRAALLRLALCKDIAGPPGCSDCIGASKIIQPATHRAPDSLRLHGGFDDSRQTGQLDGLAVDQAHGVRAQPASVFSVEQVEKSTGHTAGRTHRLRQLGRTCRFDPHPLPRLGQTRHRRQITQLVQPSGTIPPHQWADPILTNRSAEYLDRKARIARGYE